MIQAPPEWNEYGFWVVEEEGSILLFTKAIRDLFANADTDLEFQEILCI